MHDELILNISQRWVLRNRLANLIVFVGSELWVDWNTVFRDLLRLFHWTAQCPCNSDFFKCDKNTLTCPLQQLTGVPRVAACGVRRRKFNSIRQFPDSAPRAPHRPGFWPTCVSTPTLFRWRISCESGLRTFFACDFCWLDFCVRKQRYFE